MYDYKAGLNALKTNACGHSAWSKLPRSIFGGWKAGLSCRGAFEAFDAWQTAGLNARTTDGYAGKRQA